MKVNVDDCCAQIYSEEIRFGANVNSFVDHIRFLADCYARDEKIRMPISSNCASCEFSATGQEQEVGIKSGFHECWREELGGTENDFKESTILDIWSFQKKNKDRCLSQGRIKLSDIVEEDIAPRWDGKPGISPSQRQWLQVFNWVGG